MEGRLYAGFWNGGLWESCDFGKHWKKVTMPGMKNINATAMHIDCNREGEYVTVLACANHLLANHPTAISYGKEMKNGPIYMIRLWEP